MGFLKDIGKAAGVALLGPVGANIYGASEDKKAQDAANAQNLASAKEQMEFQREMANTSYQRAMEDMKKADLNPMLAFSQGGASVPTGAAATVSPSSRGIGRAVGKSMEQISSAVQGGLSLQNQSAQTQSNVGLQSAQAANATASASQAQANIKRMDMQNIQTQAETQKTIQEAKQSAETFKDRKELLQIERQMKGVDKDWQEKEKWIDNGAKVTGAIGDVAGGMFKGVMRIKDHLLNQSNSAQRNRPRTMQKENYNSKGEHTGTTSTSWTYPSN